MGEDTSLAAKSALAASAFSSAASCSPGRGAGALRLEAVMENLQRAQAARLEEKLRRAQAAQPGPAGAGGAPLPPAAPSLAAGETRLPPPHQPPARGGPATAAPAPLRPFPGGGPCGGLPSARAPPPARRPEPARRSAWRREKEAGGARGEADGEEEEEEGDEEEEEEEEEAEEDAGAAGDGPERGEEGAAGSEPRHAQRVVAAGGLASPPASGPPPPPPHEWTYEEQFKQLYELDGDPKRKAFLDDLFSFMQKRGTPVNRIPIMAKQVLDLYTLYRLVTEKGGLVEVINKKIWREITKGLNLPTSITSAAFTLRTQYMKYLYPYECDKRGLSSPGELQAAIDSNRREGRRQTFGAALFSYSPAGTPGSLASPKVPLPSLAIATHNGSQIGQAHAVKKEESLLSPGVPSRIAIPVSLAGHHLVAAQAAASQAAALEQLREKLETSEPPEKKMALVTEEQQRLVQQALQQNLLAMASQFPVNIKVNSRGDDRQETALNLSTNGISSINMSIEINGVVYTGVLFARRSGLLSTAGGAHSHASTGMPQSQLLSMASRGRAPASASP
ncbi:AT-rich interactive domain-containing protein 3C [Candoia aspera]|uniref:AT-rich interactive domain-containing protein 3C n=1 Tax=Candoia aspera TaxID=51853 RepID=UPI002FD7CED1